MKREDTYCERDVAQERNASAYYHQRMKQYGYNRYNAYGAKAVIVEWCPCEDGIPIYSPGNLFPFDQFAVGLKDGIWPEGMRVRIVYRISALDRETIRLYVVPLGKVSQRELLQRISDELREWEREAKSDAESI